MVKACPCRDPAALDMEIADRLALRPPKYSTEGPVYIATGRVAHEGPCFGPTHTWPHKQAWPDLGWAAWERARSAPALLKKEPLPASTRRRSRYAAYAAAAEGSPPQPEMVLVAALRLAGGGTLTVRSRQPERWSLSAAAKKLPRAEPTTPSVGPWERKSPPCIATPSAAEDSGCGCGPSCRFPLSKYQRGAFPRDPPKVTDPATVAWAEATTAEDREAEPVGDEEVAEAIDAQPGRCRFDD